MNTTEFKPSKSANFENQLNVSSLEDFKDQMYNYLEKEEYLIQAH